MGPEYTLRAVNYILGTQSRYPALRMLRCVSVRSQSTKTYSNNRADNSYISGRRDSRGYIIIKPDFSGMQHDDFGFLWFEDEAVVAGSVQAGSWPATLRTRSRRNQSRSSIKCARCAEECRALFKESHCGAVFDCISNKVSIQTVRSSAHVPASFSTCTWRMPGGSLYMNRSHISHSKNFAVSTGSLTTSQLLFTNAVGST